MPQGDVELFEQAHGGFADHRARREDRGGAGFGEGGEVLWRNHAADDDHDVFAAQLLQLGLQLRHERQMPGGE